MSITEFALGFAAIILGLGVADLMVSLHRLLRARARVRWDWLALSFAGLLLLISIHLWWFIYFWFRALESVSFVEFLPNMLLLCVSFLMMAAALPDEVAEEGVVLRDAYMANRAHPWLLVAAWMALNAVIQTLENIRLREFLPSYPSEMFLLATCAGLAIACARSTRVWLHAGAIAWITLLLLLLLLPVRISSS